MEFFTLGVYHSTEAEFFRKLTENHINTFCDLRQRRGVRGSEYAFVNSIRLQEKLSELNIRYGHIIGLAPTTEIREHQKEDDARKGECKKGRRALGEVFVSEYRNKILASFDFRDFIERLKNIGADRVALFCVEDKPEACHRSLVAQKLRDEYGCRMIHL